MRSIEHRQRGHHVHTLAQLEMYVQKTCPVALIVGSTRTCIVAVGTTNTVGGWAGNSRGIHTTMGMLYEPPSKISRREERQYSPEKLEEE